MSMNISEYHRPTSVGEATRLLRRRTVRSVPLAGGTALLAHPDPTIQAVVDLSRLGLDYIRQDEVALEIGAMTTLQALVVSPLTQSFAGGLLATAAHHAATRPLRNVATVGGTIFSGGATNDLVVALLTLDAEAVAADGKVRPLPDLLVGRPPVLVTAVRLPMKSSNWRTALVRIARLPTDRAIVNVAAAVRLDGFACADIRLAAGGVGSHPLRLPLAEERLRGTALQAADLFEAVARQQKTLQPPSDVLGSGAYRRAMLSVLVQRAVRRCQAKEAP